MVLYPLLPETPYWLVLNGDLAAAEAVLQKMARINGVPLPEVKQTCSMHDRQKFRVECSFAFMRSEAGKEGSGGYHVHALHRGGRADHFSDSAAHV